MCRRRCAVVALLLLSRSSATHGQCSTARDVVQPEVRMQVDLLMDGTPPLPSWVKLADGSNSSREHILGRASNLSIANFAKLCGKKSCWLERRTHDWLATHPAASMDSEHHRTLGISLYGIAGVAVGRSTFGRISTDSERMSAASVVEHVIGPAEAAGLRVSLVAHAWVQPSRHNVSSVLSETYGKYLAASLFEPIRRDYSSKQSVVLSIVTSLNLMRRASRQGAGFDLVLLMRHDCTWFAELPLAHLNSQELVVATKCNFSPNMALHGPNCSTELGTYWLADLAPDFWFIGGQSLVEYFFGSLHLRFSNGEQIAHESERSQLVQLAQQHNIDLSNAPCGVLRSHPHAIEGMHFLLYRHRGLQVVVDDRGRSSGKAWPGGCNAGRKVCYRDPSAARQNWDTLVAAGIDPGPFS